MKQDHLTQQHILKHPEKLARFSKVWIWSKQWEAWWKQESGYTDKIKLAGIFTQAEAWRKVRHCGPEKKIILQAVKTRCEHCGAIIR